MRNPRARTDGTTAFPSPRFIPWRKLASLVPCTSGFAETFRAGVEISRWAYRDSSFIACLFFAVWPAVPCFAQQPVLHPVAVQVAEAGMAPPEGEAVKCGLPGIMHALQQQERSPRQRQTLQEILSRPVMQTSIVNGGFRVHFDTTGLNAPAMLDAAGNRLPGSVREYVDSVFAVLSFVSPLETTTLGYGTLRADGSNGGGPEYDIYIMELGNMYGYTTPDASGPEGSTSPTSITIDNDFIFVRPNVNRGMPGLRVTLAHELHHALQIGNYGFWTNDVFLYEITSTWMEDVAYTDVNDYYNYLVASWGHFKNPDQPFNSNELIMYSRSIWGHYISKKFGIAVMRQTWEQVRLARPMVAIDNALRLQGVDAASAFAEWILWNYFTGPRADPVRYYGEGAAYPLISQSPVEFTPSARDLQGTLLPFASRYYQVMRGTDTVSIVLGNIDLGLSLQSPLPALPYTLRLRNTQPDPSYRAVIPGLYCKLDVADIGQWSIWYVDQDSARSNYDPEILIEGRPFPNPFKLNGQTRVYFPVNSPTQVQGSVYIFDSGNVLIRATGPAATETHLGKQMFSWDGLSDGGGLAASGVYVYVIELPDRHVKGKIAVVRE
jgi:hypothetical protein